MIDRNSLLDDAKNNVRNDTKDNAKKQQDEVKNMERTFTLQQIMNRLLKDKREKERDEKARIRVLKAFLSKFFKKFDKVCSKNISNEKVEKISELGNARESHGDTAKQK